MAGNPKASPWFSTSQDARKRKVVRFTLSDEAREALAEMAGDGSASAVVDEAILALHAKRRKKPRG